MRSIVRLAPGARFQLARALGSPLTLQPNTTLAEIISNKDLVPFQPAIQTAGMEYPDDYNYQTDTEGQRIQYIAIGVGGHYNIDGATHGIPGIGTYPHRARDTNFFRIFPFVIRDINDDLTPDQRKMYCGRKVLLVNKQPKIAYYLRREDFSTYPIRQEIVKVVGGVRQSTPYVPSANDMAPKPTKPSGINDGTFIKTFIDFELAFDTEQSKWIADAAELLYGDRNAAVVSEIAICSGVDKPITKRYPFTGDQTPQTVTGSLREASGVTLTIIESTHMALNFKNGYAAEQFTIGTEDPLYGENFG